MDFHAHYQYITIQISTHSFPHLTHTPITKGEKIQLRTLFGRSKKKKNQRKLLSVFGARAKDSKRPPSGWIKDRLTKWDWGKR